MPKFVQNMGISMNYTVTRPRQLEIAGFCFMMKLRVVYFHFPPFPGQDAAVVQFFFCCLSSYASLIFCNGSINIKDETFTVEIKFVLFSVDVRVGPKVMDVTGVHFTVSSLNCRCI